MEALKVLEREVETALRTEEQIVLPPNSVGSTPAFEATLKPLSEREEVVFGFTRPAQDATAKARDDHRVKRREQINKYRRDAAVLRDELKVRGVEPLAIITDKAWARIVAIHGLFEVAPDRYGRVTFNNEWIEQLRKTPRVLQVLCVSVAVMLSAVVCWTLSPWWTKLGGTIGATPTPGFFLFFTAVVSVMAVIILPILGSAVAEWVTSSWIAPRRIRKLVASSTHEELLVKASGSTRKLSYNYGGSIRVVFPEPPSSVVKLLDVIANSGPWFGNQTSYPQLYVAAEAGAIHFEGGWASVLDDEVEAQRLREEAMRRDPILYIIYGSAVAVLEQYGPEFAWEKFAIDAVVNSEHLL